MTPLDVNDESSIELIWSRDATSFVETFTRDETRQLREAGIVTDEDVRRFVETVAEIETSGPEMRATRGFKVLRTDRDNETTLAVEGELDDVTAPELRYATDQIINKKRLHVTVDLSRLDVIDNAGVYVVVGLYKRVRNYGGTVRLVGLKGQPLAIYKLLRLDRVFPI